MTAAVLALRTTIVAHRFPLALAGAVLALVAAVGFAVSVGAVAIPVGTVWAIALDQVRPGLVHGDWSAGRANIVWEIRFPRALLAAIVGAGLALVGTALQAVTRNPLADPHLLGVSSGASFGAILALLHTGLFLGLVTLPLFAFAGALVATGLVMIVSKATGARSADRLVLVGVAVSFVIMAAANFLIFLGDPRATHTVVFWMLGGFGMAAWGHLAWPLGALLLGGGWLMVRARLLTAMTVGDETAASLGIEVERFRLSVFVVTAFLTGAMVAFSGAIGFVGLMVPHLVRLVVGGSVERMVPLAALVGAVFLVLADAAARLLAAPEDMPIGIVTGVVGGLFFLAMMGRKRA